MLHNFIGCEGLNKLACIRCSSTGNVKEYYNLLNELRRISSGSVFQDTATMGGGIICCIVQRKIVDR